MTVTVLTRYGICWFGISNLGLGSTNRFIESVNRRAEYRIVNFDLGQLLGRRKLPFDGPGVCERRFSLARGNSTLPVVGRNNRKALRRMQ
jgi:hypothetical protein